MSWNHTGIRCCKCPEKNTTSPPPSSMLFDEADVGGLLWEVKTAPASGDPPVEDVSEDDRQMRYLGCYGSRNSVDTYPYSYHTELADSNPNPNAECGKVFCAHMDDLDPYPLMTYLQVLRPSVSFVEMPHYKEPSLSAHQWGKSFRQWIPSASSTMTIQIGFLLVGDFGVVPFGEEARCLNLDMKGYAVWGVMLWNSSMGEVWYATYPGPIFATPLVHDSKLFNGASPRIDMDFGPIPNPANWPGSGVGQSSDYFPPTNDFTLSFLPQAAP